MSLTITDPTNILEPAHLGQMFFDAYSQVFYQARGTTASDWQLVTPAELPGSFVKIFDLFPGLPENDPAGPEVALMVAEAEAVRRTMALDGVAVLQAHAWKTSRGVDAMLARVRFDRVDDLTIFIGFAESPRAHAMPKGTGFYIRNGNAEFGTHRIIILPRETVMLRVELHDERRSASAYVDDKLLGRSYSCGGSIPVMATFSHAPGPRRVAPGYERALQRRLGA